jgi:enoyl-CoA hydratase/carnithine racemase
MTEAAAEILFSHENGIGIITLNRPQARNALTFAMYEEIARIAADPQAMGATRALILTGAQAHTGLHARYFIEQHGGLVHLAQFHRCVFGLRRRARTFCARGTFR